MNDRIMTEQKNQFSHILRWVLALPVGVLAAVLITFPLHWILYMTLSGGQDPFIAPYPRMPEKLLQPLCSAWVFVFTCGWVVPRANKLVAKIAALLWTVSAIAIVVLAKTDVLQEGQKEIGMDYFGLPVVSGILGALFGLFYTKKQLKQ